VAPGSIATIFGSDLSTTQTTATGAPLPTLMAGTAVRVNGLAVPLVFASPKQINFQVPSITAGRASLQVWVGGLTAPTVAFNVAAAAPAIFVQQGTDHAVAQNEDASVNSAANPAFPGSVIVVYLTGQGPLDNPVPSGNAATNAPVSRALLTPTATIGLLNAQVDFVGLTPGFVGLAQANVRVPSLPRGEYPLVLTIGGASSNAALVSVGER
jgi:uncharacterized protein (TIGR03437 family)